ncbi:fetal and adult testis-expressed transcript protein [Notamacropus eugenii]|uniref:fetal and adult testis-expressed transcript protein n=1 Tax=Notamacropus eugenii TaxID=9315 RepID=UPI003B68253C
MVQESDGKAFLMSFLFSEGNMLTPGWSVSPLRLWGDMNLTEAISQSLQGFGPFKLPGGAKKEEPRGKSGNLLLSFYLNVSHRLLLGDRGARANSQWINQLRGNSTYLSDILAPTPSLTTNNLFSAVFSSIKARNLISPVVKVMKDKACGDDTPMAAEDEVNPENGSREGGLAVEEGGGTEIAALKKQLHKISGRLQALEARCSGWRQKEFLLYSALISACVINTWLWMRR